VKLADLAPAPQTILEVEDHIIDQKTLQDVMCGLSSKGPVRVSGVQAKLPVVVSMHKEQPKLELGVLAKSCGHIIKYQSPMFPNIVGNEWATMELGRPAGLNVATVRMINATNKTALVPGRALLIERCDVPGKRDLEEMHHSLKLALQEDAASLLYLSRADKYGTSAERVATTLVDLKLSEGDLWLYLWHPQSLRTLDIAWIAFLSLSPSVTGFRHCQSINRTQPPPRGDELRHVKHVLSFPFIAADIMRSRFSSLHYSRART
jgi:hypothetical protein